MHTSRIPWKGDGSGPVASDRATLGYEFVVHVPDLNVCPDACVRPVGLAFDGEGRLFVSSDSTGEVSGQRDYISGGIDDDGYMQVFFIESV